MPTKIGNRVNTMRYIITLVLIATFLITGGISSVYSASSSKGTINRITITKKFKEQMEKSEYRTSADSSEVNGKPFSVKYLMSNLERYELPDDAVLTDVSGKRISSDQLRLPATVRLEYQKLSSGMVNVVSLKVLRVSSPSSARWEEPGPD